MFPLSHQSIISNQMRPRRLRGAWFCHLLRHPARRQSGSILRPGTHMGLGYIPVEFLQLLSVCFALLKWNVLAWFNCAMSVYRVKSGVGVRSYQARRLWLVCAESRAFTNYVPIPAFFQILLKWSCDQNFGHIFRFKEKVLHYVTVSQWHFSSTIQNWKDAITE